MSANTARREGNKIAIFLPSLGGGGVERVMVNLTRGFTEKGIQVDLVLTKAEGPYLAEVTEKARVVDLRARRVLFSLPKLAHYLRSERPTVLLAGPRHANIVALWAKRLSCVRTRVVISEHNALRQSVWRARTVRSKALPLLMRWFYPWADAIVAVSQGVAHQLAEITRVPPEKVRVIYNPVITPELLSKADEPLDHPWFQPDEPPVLLGVGRLSKQKDFPLLVRAFAQVRKEYLARLMILGEGEDRPKLEGLIRELGLEADVALPGFVDNPYKYMKRAAVFVLSSRWEGFGNVLVEAMAVGTPVISTDCRSGPAEILEEDRWGRLVPVGDAEKLADAIRDCLRQDLREDRRGASEHGQRTFGLDSAVEKYIEVLLEMS